MADKPFLMMALAACLFAGAQQLATAQAPAVRGAAASDPQAMSGGNGAAAPGNRRTFDPAVVSRGRVAFENACTECHDADRALSKRKDLAGWLATVRRMARQDGADIDPADFQPIATYLASLSQPSPTAAQADTGAATASATAGGGTNQSLGSGLSLSGTVSTLWRGGNDNLENPDFFADVWLRADWQPEGPLRGRVTACTSCHSDVTGGGGFTLELVEATAHYDLLHWLRQHRGVSSSQSGRLQAGVKAGRFVVPFGAFSARVHPGAYRTATMPLMFNMGRNVAPNPTRPPVLPMPYSDEGVDLDAKISLPLCLTATLDAYAVNGLQGFGPGVQFTPSRSYADNNSEPAAGGRATIGNRMLRVGGSVMSGRMQNEGQAPLDYHLSGADATFRYEDLLRFYFEYAIRRNGSDRDRGQIVYGTLYEGELLLLARPSINLLVRYDTLDHRDANDPSFVERFTWGINSTLPGGSLLMVNHERWNFAKPEPDVDVIGLRWVATF